VTDKWDERFIGLAEHISTWSKDPSTKCGAVIVRPDKTVCSVGYNGFPKHFSDSPELYEDKEKKYSRVIHAEMNAILSSKESMQGYTIYLWPFCCCDRCTVHIVQAGISRVVFPESTNVNWSSSFEKSKEYLQEASVQFTELTSK